MAKVLIGLDKHGFKNDISIEKLQALTFEDIENIYVGKKNCCRCGCGGEYKDFKHKPISVKRALTRLKTFLAETNDETYTIMSDSTINDGIVEFYLTCQQDKPYARCTTIYLKKREVKPEV